MTRQNGRRCCSWWLSLWWFALSILLQPKNVSVSAVVLEKRDTLRVFAKFLANNLSPPSSTEITVVYYSSIHIHRRGGFVLGTFRVCLFVWAFYSMKHNVDGFVLLYFWPFIVSFVLRGTRRSCRFGLFCRHLFIRRFYRPRRVYVSFHVIVIVTLLSRASFRTSPVRHTGRCLVNINKFFASLGWARVVFWRWS